jgi:hypothetical protein
MEPIDRPFRFTWDFCVVWVLLAVAAFFLTRDTDFENPWYSYIALLILLPLLATFVLYGPVLLARQVIRSGSRGWFVARMLLALLLAAEILFSGLYFSGYYTEPRARLLVLFLWMAATAFLSWRTGQR